MSSTSSGTYTPFSPSSCSAALWIAGLRLQGHSGRQAGEANGTQCHGKEEHHPAPNSASHCSQNKARPPTHPPTCGSRGCLQCPALGCRAAAASGHTDRSAAAAWAGRGLQQGHRAGRGSSSSESRDAQRPWGRQRHGSHTLQQSARCRSQTSGRAAKALPPTAASYPNAAQQTEGRTRGAVRRQRPKGEEGAVLRRQQAADLAPLSHGQRDAGHGAGPQNGQHTVCICGWQRRGVLLVGFCSRCGWWQAAGVRCKLR